MYTARARNAGHAKRMLFLYSNYIACMAQMVTFVNVFHKGKIYKIYTIYKLETRYRVINFQKKIKKK